MPYGGETAALLTAACWSISGTAFEAAGRRIGSLSLNLIRLLIAFAFHSALGLARTGEILPWRADDEAWAWLAASGLVGFTFGDLFLFRALVLIGARLTLLVALSATPVLTALFGFVALGEALSPVRWVGMALTVAGVAWVLAERAPAGGARAGEDAGGAPAAGARAAGDLAGSHGAAVDPAAGVRAAGVRAAGARAGSHGAAVDPAAGVRAAGASAVAVRAPGTPAAGAPAAGASAVAVRAPGTPAAGAPAAGVRAGSHGAAVDPAASAPAASASAAGVRAAGAPAAGAPAAGVRAGSHGAAVDPAAGVRAAGAPAAGARAPGVALALAAAVGQAAALVLAKLGMSHLDDAFAATQVRVAAGIAGFAIVCLATGWWPRVIEAATDVPAMGLASLGAFFGPFLGIGLSLYAVHHTEAGVAAALMSVAPIVVIPIAVLVFRERVGVRAIGGAAAAVAGVAALVAG